MKARKSGSSKEPVMVKKTRSSDFELNKKKSESVTEDYQDFGKMERKPEKSKRWGNQERRGQ